MNLFKHFKSRLYDKWSPTNKLFFWLAIISIIIGLSWGETLSDYINDKFGPKPEVLINTVIFRSANLDESESQIENFYFLYLLGPNLSTLYFLDSSDKEKIDRYDNIIDPGPIIDFKNCPDCSYYSFTLKNIGKKRVDKLILDIRSNVTPYLVRDNPKMIEKNCGGTFTNRGCYLTFDKIQVGEESNFVLMTKEASDLRILNCEINDKYSCEFRFIKVLIQDIISNKAVLVMNNIKISLPKLDNSNPNILYYFDLNQSDESKTTWVSIPAGFDEGK